jgi:hypothetical protein
MISVPFATRPTVMPSFNGTLADFLGMPGPIDREVVDAVNDFTRQRMHEDSVYRLILPPVPIPNDELDGITTILEG